MLALQQWILYECKPVLYLLRGYGKLLDLSIEYCMF